MYPESQYGTIPINSKTASGSSSTSSSQDPEENRPEPVALRKELGLINGVTIIVGVIVGSGIFVSPRGVIQEAGSVGLSLIIWVLCGLLSTIGALCYAELGTFIPESGGDYAYLRKAFGGLPAFLFLWASILIIQPAGNAIAALTFANYILVAISPNVAPDPIALRLIAAAVITLLVFINCYSVKWSTRLQDSLTSAKVLAIALIVICGTVVLILRQNNDSLTFPKSFENTTRSPGSIALAFYSGIYSYAGWNYLNFVVEELRDPFKNLPRAIYISVPLVTLIYVLSNVAYFAVLTPAEVINSPAVAVTFGNRLLGSFAWIMPLAVALSTFGGLNGCIFASSRLFFVGARNGHLPDCLALINIKYFTPIPSLVLLGILSLIYLCTTEIYILINYCTFVESSSILASIAALIYLRYRDPDSERPIKVNLIWPIIFFIACLFMVSLPFFESPMESLIGVAIAASGIPVYFITISWEKKPSGYKHFIASITKIVQKLSNSVPEN